MIEDNLPLVSYVVGKMGGVLTSGVIEREDAHAYGVEGLIHAVDNFDPENGATFSTFALVRIRGAILDAVRRQDVLPRSSRKLMRRVDAAELELAQQLGRWPSVNEVAVSTGLAPGQVLATRQLKRMRLISLENALSKDPARRAVMWDIEDLDERANPDAHLEEEALRELLERAIASLPARDRTIIELRYRQALPISSIGRVLAVSDSRISQLHKRILVNLRQILVDELNAADAEHCASLPLPPRAA
jgi:RNA polymerase sigma factor for flagellar operon FliA